MKPSSGTNKQSVASGLKTKKIVKEKRKSNVTTNEATTSKNSERSPTKDSRNYVGYDTEQLQAILEQTTGDTLTEEAAAAFVEDLNYKLRFVIHDALTQARLCDRRGIIPEDLSKTLERLGEEKIFGAPSNPNWDVISDPSDQAIHYLEDPVVNLFELSEKSVTYIDPGNAVVTSKYFPPTDKDNLITYYKFLCKAVVDNDKELRTTALKEIRSNSSIGPIVKLLYNYSYSLLLKVRIYKSLTTYVLQFIECLELNPISGLVVSKDQLVALALLLYKRLLKATPRLSLMKPICRVLALMCRKIVLRKMILKKILTHHPKAKRFFIFPIMCLANEMGIDAVKFVIMINIRYILYIVRISNQTDITYEALRTYYILCRAEQYNKHLYRPFYDVFGEGIMPYSINKPYRSLELPLAYDWLNVKKALYINRRKISLPPKHKQKKIRLRKVFSIPKQINGVSSDNKLKARRRDKMQRIHPTNFKPVQKESFLIIVAAAKLHGF